MTNLQNQIILVLSAGVLIPDSIPPPDIHAETLQEYIGNDFADWKILHSIYVAVLQEELDSLACEISFCLGNAPPVENAFSHSHKVFMNFATAQADYAETIQWYDLSSGEACYGSGEGHTRLSVLSSVYWERILQDRA